MLPPAVFAESATPSLGYTGAPTDHGGQNCSTCHTGNLVNDPKGSLQVMVNDYASFSQQLIRIIVQHPQSSRWGFQMTIRGQSTETVSAGTFSLASPPGAVQIVCDDGSQFGSTKGCAGNSIRWFAEHMNAPLGSPGAAHEFDINWTPPAQEIGRIEVYVAAVAADGDGTPEGDFVYTATKTLQNVGVCDDAVAPILNNVVNGATFQQPFSSLAMVSLFGHNFHLQGFPRTAGLGDYVNNSYPTELGCVSVQATQAGMSPVLLPIAYVDTTQINAQMPEFTGSGPVAVSVILNPGGTNEFQTPMVTLPEFQPFAPAFFLFANSTSIAAEEAQTGALVANPAVVTGATPAKPGDIVALFGTGFGETSPALAAGELASSATKLANSISVTIGGVTLASSDVLYAGLSPGSIDGLYQINVRIPAGTSSGDVPVSITIGGETTQSGATIPIQ